MSDEPLIINRLTSFCLGSIVGVLVGIPAVGIKIGSFPPLLVWFLSAGLGLFLLFLLILQKYWTYVENNSAEDDTVPAAYDPNSVDYSDLTTIPSRLEISPTNGLNLDEQWALSKLEGKTAVDLKSALLAEPDSAYPLGEVYYYLGGRAFAYYFPVYADFLMEVSEDDLSQELSVLLDVLEFRLENDPRSVQAVRAPIQNLVRFCLNRLSRFIDPTGSFPNPEPRLQALLAGLGSL